MPTPVRALLALAAAAGLLLGTPAGASASTTPGDLTNPKHFFHGVSQAPSPGALQNDLIYHGGNAGPGAIGVERNPSVYLVWWGPQWRDGFVNYDSLDNSAFPSSTLQTYVESFFRGIGGTPWAGVQTQYCRGVPAGTTNCVGASGAQFVTNPTGQLKGTWTDPSPVPADIIGLGLAENLVDDPIAAEASKAARHFGYRADATYIVLTPPGTVATGEPVYCGYHTQTTSIDGLGNRHTLQYSFIPYQNTDWPGIGTNDCGQHWVNKGTSNAFGNGIFDGYSIVTGHEYGEAVTDPDNILSNQDGWNDAQGSENGDKCAWNYTSDIAVGANTFAVQAMWSNEAFDAGLNGCQYSRIH